MKKTIIILSGGIVAILLLWPADKKLLNKTSEPKSAESQKNVEAVQKGFGSRAKDKGQAKIQLSCFGFLPKAY